MINNILMKFFYNFKIILILNKKINILLVKKKLLFIYKILIYFSMISKKYLIYLFILL